MIRDPGRRIGRPGERRHRVGLRARRFRGAGHGAGGRGADDHEHHVPSAATRGVPFAYGATVTDRWVTPTSTWNFGDNTTGALSATKTFTGTGVFNPVLTATDPSGNTATSTPSSTVSAPPPAVGGTGAGGSVQIAGASVSGLRQSHRIWREGGHLATFAAEHKSPVGTTFTFTLDQRQP